MRCSRTINHPCRPTEGFLVDLVVAENLHLAAEQLRGAAISHRHYSTANHVSAYIRIYVGTRSPTFRFSSNRWWTTPKGLGCRDSVRRPLSSYAQLSRSS